MAHSCKDKNGKTILDPSFFFQSVMKENRNETKNERISWVFQVATVFRALGNKANWNGKKIIKEKLILNLEVAGALINISWISKMASFVTKIFLEMPKTLHELNVNWRVCFF